MAAPKIKWFPEFEEKLPSLEGKTIAISGCTAGIGLVVAKTCAKKGPKDLLLINRSSERATKAEEAIKALVKDDKTNVVTIPCDLQDFESIKAAIASIKSNYDSIDVLCNNAGVAMQPDKATKDGYDVQMQTNHLSHFMIVRDLLPLLKKAAEVNGEARIVHHSSAARSQGSGLEEKYFEKNGGNLGGDGGGWMGPKSKRYAQSKLANSVFTMALKEKLAGTGIKAVVAAPGTSSTGMLDHAQSANSSGMVDWLMNSMITRLAQSIEDGSMPILAACFDPSTESGDFWEPKSGMNSYGPAVKVKVDKKTADPKNAEIMWSKSEEAVGKFEI